MNNLILDFLDCMSISGNEEQISLFIEKYIKNNAKKTPLFKKDALGNLYVSYIFDKNYKNVLISAHMDETGFVVGSINKNGTLSIVNQGGFVPYTIINSRVILKNDNGENFKGMIYVKEDANASIQRLFDMKHYFADFGFKDKNDAEKNFNITPGNTISFEPNNSFICNNRILGKSIDNRVSNYVIASKINEIWKIAKENKYNIHFAFLVQEEVGCRGANVVSHNIDPDIVINLDVSPSRETTSDKIQIKNYSKMGSGVHLRLIDATYITRQETIKFLKNIYEKNNIKFSYYVSAGGTDSGNISLSKSGYVVIPLTIGYRYNHGFSQIVDYYDVLEMKKALLVILKNLNNNSINSLVSHYNLNNSK